MILILLFTFWLTLACLMDRYVCPLFDRFVPSFPRCQVVMVFWIALGALVLATNEQLLFAKLLTFLPVAAAHIHVSRIRPTPMGWQDLLRHMAHLGQVLIQNLRRKLRI